MGAPPMSRGRTIIRVIAVEVDGLPMDREDTETARLWVVVPDWSPRRAFLTGASPFVLVSGKDPEDLAGVRFFAELDLHNPPSNNDTHGERLEWPGLGLCPPFKSSGVVPVPVLASGPDPLKPRRVDSVSQGGGEA